MVSPLTLVGGIAVAQEPAAPVAEPSGVEEITVTAERRRTSLQKTPIAVSAFTAKALEDRSIKDVQDLAQTAPGLNFNKVSNFVQLSIRGISLEQINLGGEPGVALHQDGVYLARPFVADALFSDLERVEVLRGPQGTLYGRNATGGSVNLISNEPTDEASARLGLTVGNYSRIRVDAMANGRLAEGVDARASFVFDKRDGYIENLVDGSDLDDSKVGSGRASVKFRLSPDATFLVTADYAKEDDTGPVFDVGRITGTAPALGGRYDDDPRTIYLDGPASNKRTNWGLLGRLVWEFEGATLTSLTAYRESEFHLQSDLDGTDFFLVNEDLNEKGKQFSQEIQLASNGTGPFQWLAGVYAFTEDGTLGYDFPIPLLGATIMFDATQDTTAFAAFGQATYAFDERFSITAGLRYSYEKKKGHTDMVFIVPSSVDVRDDWSALTPRLALNFQVTPNNLLYASVARGFKAGGINTGSVQEAAYDPEYIWSYEVGSKNRFWDGRFQLNLAAFFYKYTDLQVNQFAVGRTFITNAASAEGKGLEAEFVLKPFEGFTLDGTLTLLDTEFTDFTTLDTFRPTLGLLNLSGNELPRAPNFMLSLGAQYAFSLADGSTLTVRADYSHKDDYYYTPFNTEYARADAIDLLNARISYESADGAWQAAVFGRNLTDEVYTQTITVSGINAGTIELYAPPFTWGVEVRRFF
jgi:iron complex outermembrane receptor protein